MGNVRSLFVHIGICFIIFGVYKILLDVKDKNNESFEESGSINADFDSDNISESSEDMCDICTYIDNAPNLTVSELKRKAVERFTACLNSLDLKALAEEVKKWRDGSHQCLKRFSPEKVNQIRRGTEEIWHRYMLIANSKIKKVNIEKILNEHFTDKDSIYFTKLLTNS